MRIEFRQPVADDFRRVEVNDFDVECLSDMGQHAEQIAALAAIDPYALTCLQDGRVVGIGGILQTGEAWVILSRDCRHAMPAMLRLIRQNVVDFALTYGEVWATIDPDRPNARRWAAVLGFEEAEEGIWRLSCSDLL